MTPAERYKKVSISLRQGRPTAARSTGLIALNYRGRLGKRRTQSGLWSRAGVGKEDLCPERSLRISNPGGSLKMRQDIVVIGSSYSRAIVAVASRSRSLETTVRLYVTP